jgi:hypothetical protein
MIAQHFQLNDALAYQQWREKKLAAYPLKLANYQTYIKDIHHPSVTELARIQAAYRATNMAFYYFSSNKKQEKKLIYQLGTQLGLKQLDNNLCADQDHLTSIRVTQHQGQHNYIPYSNKRLSWHTDGYYNTSDQQVRGMILHCSMPAMQGGESLLMDHEILYILLRDQNPAWISALMHSNCMTIPANILNGKIIRPICSGPVFSFDAKGQLHMRYSARLKNIQWRDDPDTQAARAFIQTLWQAEDSPYILCYTLQAGEGLICNNVLHRRTAFSDNESDAQKRLLYRGRYYDRLN